MFRICDGATAAEGYCCPTVVLVGTSFQFSDRLIKLLKVDFDDIYFERSMDSNIVLEHETQPRVIIVHESCDDLEGRISLFQRKLPKTQIAVACSDTTIIERLNVSDRFTLLMGPGDGSQPRGPDPEPAGGGGLAHQIHAGPATVGAAWDHP